MPSTAPTLTWQMTNLRSPGTPTDPQTVIDTLALSIGDVTRWEVKTSAAGWINIGPIAASNTPNIRVIIAFGVNVGQVLAPHNLVADSLYMGIAPDDGVDQDPLGATGPCSSARWTGYWKITDSLAADPADSVFAIGSDEIVSLWLLEAGAPDDWYGGVAGAIIDPPTDADGEGTPGRVYGMMVSGATAISPTFWASTTGFTSSGSNNAHPMLGVFQPAVPANFLDCDRFTITPTGSPRMVTAGGTQVSVPQTCFFENAPSNCVGVYRQMRYSHDGTMRTVVTDSGGADKSYWVTGQSLSNGDVLSFDNG